MVLGCARAEEPMEAEAHGQTLLSEDNEIVAGQGTDGTKSDSWMHGFVSSISVILVSEIGDKTFFIAAVMAMAAPRLTVFAGAISALAVMTVLSVVMGTVTSVIPRYYTYMGSNILMLIFGVRMLKEAHEMDNNASMEELDEVTEEINQAHDGESADIESGEAPSVNPITAFLAPIVGPVYLQAFTLTFLAEWGDRSQVTTIVLGAVENGKAVILGGILGHACCTCAAVMGGRLLAQRISVKNVTYVGSAVFLLFGVLGFMFPPEDIDVVLDTPTTA